LEKGLQRPCQATVRLPGAFRRIVRGDIARQICVTFSLSHKFRRRCIHLGQIVHKRACWRRRGRDGGFDKHRPAAMMRHRRLDRHEALGPVGQGWFRIVVGIVYQSDSTRLPNIVRHRKVARYRHAGAIRRARSAFGQTAFASRKEAKQGLACNRLRAKSGRRSLNSVVYAAASQRNASSGRTSHHRDAA
jgi:hypothetical protein